MAIWNKEGGCYAATLGRGFQLSVSRAPGGYAAEVFGREIPGVHKDVPAAQAAAEAAARAQLASAIEALGHVAEAPLGDAPVGEGAVVARPADSPAGWFRIGGTDRWEALLDAPSLREWAARLLRGKAGSDSDGGYIEYVEIAAPDGGRIFAAASFSPFEGEWQDFAFGTEGEVKRLMGDYAVERHPFGPGRDWMRV